MRTGPVCQGTASPAVAVLEYDPQGNVDLRNTEDYSFDLGNRLRQVAGKEWYAYDGHGRRVLSCTSAACDYQQYGFDGKLYLHRDNRANKLFDNIYLGGSLVAIREQPAGGGAVSVRYQHTDALGSPVLVTDQNRAVVQAQTSEYEPYGWPANRAWRDGPGYTGHVEDAATRLTYMQQRYYDPQLGIFLSVDPVTAYSNPVAMFNRYRYANNNPYRFKDPDGRKCETTDGKASCTFDEFKDNKGNSISREQALSSGNRFTRALGIDRGSRILRAEAAMTSKYSDAKNLAARGGEVTIKGNQSLGIPDQKVSGSAIVSRMESTRTIANAGANPINADSIASVKVTVTGAPSGEPINFWRDGAGADIGKTFGHEILHTIYSGVGLENRGWTNGDFNLQHQAPFDEASDEIR